MISTTLKKSQLSYIEFIRNERSLVFLNAMIITCMTLSMPTLSSNCKEVQFHTFLIRVIKEYLLLRRYSGSFHPTILKKHK